MCSRTRIDALIGYDAASSSPAQLDEARIRGAEFTFDFTLAGFDIARS